MTEPQGERPSGLAFIPKMSVAGAALLLAIVSELLFLINLQHPQQMMFDETHYVPAARALFFGHEYLVRDHPEFAKWLIGLSMYLFGDTPWGWRVIGTMMGTLTVVTLFLIAQSLFRDTRLSLVAGFIALLSQFVYILARLAMLDVYMGAFLLLALWLVIDGYARDGNRWRLLFAGILFGLAIGCKWVAVPYVALIIAAFGLLRLRAERNFSRLLFSSDVAVWRGVSTVEAMLYLGPLAIAVYFATFIPTFYVENNALAPADLLQQQKAMFEMHSAFYTHPYSSQWWQWPYIGRPIWFLYEKVDGVLRGVLMAGNPAVLWGGLVAVMACLIGGVVKRQPRVLLVGCLYLFAYGIWIVIPRKLNFHYYYYLPVIFLSLALAVAFHFYCRGRITRWIPLLFLILAFGLFVYFYPIISAAPLPRDDAFLRWTWFDSWR
jgi:dolichyl-phosphate-mannose--protein O-mannosyl transferase